MRRLGALRGDVVDGAERLAGDPVRLGRRGRHRLVRRLVRAGRGGGGAVEDAAAAHLLRARGCGCVGPEIWHSKHYAMVVQTVSEPSTSKLGTRMACGVGPMGTIHSALGVCAANRTRKPRRAKPAHA